MLTQQRPSPINRNDQFHILTVSDVGVCFCKKFFLPSLLSDVSTSFCYNPMAQPARPPSQSLPPVFPYTLREALYGNAALEPCVSRTTHSWPEKVTQRMKLFEPILDRPKQAIQHLLELFILHVCRMETPSDPYWLTSLLDYLAAVSQHLIPAVQPVRSVQWAAAVYDKAGKPVLTVPQTEESFPRNVRIDTTLILDIVSSYSSSFKERDISKDELSLMTGLMDQPAKTAVMVYAWLLASLDVRNGWLRPLLHATLGRRERPPNVTLPEGATSDGRLRRMGEELHTLFSQAYVDRMGHLVWYTVRQALPGEIIGRPATSYARGNNVRIQSSKDLSKSVRIHHSQICNIKLLDFRLWESWTHSSRGVGPYAGLSNRVLSARRVRFEEPVLIEDALAVGFRVVNGSLISPSGKEMLVSKRADGIYTARNPILRCPERNSVPWHAGIKFA